nr:ADP-ribosylglycohydrolase family protein [Methylorubrum zatmanii]
MRTARQLRSRTKHGWKRPFNLKPGEWTDDTALGLALGQSLRAIGRLDEHDLLTRFRRRSREGENSVSGHCIDIGSVTATALTR